MSAQISILDNSFEKFEEPLGTDVKQNVGQCRFDKTSFNLKVLFYKALQIFGLWNDVDVMSM